ncbi:MAG: hypothetical protein KGO96_02915 [Elusimicrobia bacterium]|nr:hypothetical protein [Elusimicrobiota bacterium]MDE2424845.1 hypothetical protein [Elusimicrobiota bacterium]
MKRIAFLSSFLLYFSVPALAGARGATAATAEDLGPSTIDVSSYPEEYQKTYQDVFIPFFKIRGGAARAVNSPIIELDMHLEEQERRDHPQLFQEAGAAVVSRDGWKQFVEKLYATPACCGACPVLTRAKARALWRFFVYDSIQRKTGRQAAHWVALRKDLLDRFREKEMIAKETAK